ncbi:uncharacterized protein B0T15DRAFT_543515 [Chaetomium strumarium]|uniref:Uncharacterized protein n=1 Tax=Chaetomium strumarium TaxID=1170767 RepID=A0AAJ0LYQ6_9PEZI|nr:hypothetical protein B0T15DRAFT_543515 [Chaetomium strumarium]
MAIPTTARSTSDYRSPSLFLFSFFHSLLFLSLSENHSSPISSNQHQILIQVTPPEINQIPCRHGTTSPDPGMGEKGL